MSVLKSLNFVALPKTNSSDPFAARRRKLLLQLQQQKKLAGDPTYVEPRQKWIKREDGTKELVQQPKRVKRWWREDLAGNTFLIVRYGNKVIEFDKGKSAIAVGKAENLAEVIDAVMRAVEAGELDAALAAIGGVERARKPKRAA